jgi:protein SFI1
MHKFRPTRASPPSKSLLLPDHSLHTDISCSTVVSVPELASLTEQEVELLDTVIQRAGHSATTFLTVFKAYNDVLNERGLDPHEVLYYGKLLKLGTLKGKNWGDKWCMVKAQYSYQGSYSDTHAQRHPQSHVSSRVFKAIHERVERVKRVEPRHPESSFTLHSRTDESDLEMDQDSAAFSVVKSRRLVKSDDSPHNVGHPQAAMTGWGRGPSDGPRRRTRRSEAYVSTVAEESIIPTTPPSYHAALRDRRIYKEHPPIRNLATSTQSLEGDSARKAVALAREQRGNIVNDQDAWNKIKMERDERDADIFWSDRLLERCWDVWKQGFQWVIVRYIYFPFDFDEAYAITDHQSANQQGSRQFTSSLELATLA